MIKKNSMLAYAFLITSLAASLHGENKKDKYEEWCQNLDLNEEQAQKLSSYLDEFKSLATKEKLQSYRNAVKENKTAEEKFLEDTEAQIFWLKTQQLIEDRVLCKALVQMLLLTGLDISYLIHNKDLEKLGSEENPIKEIDIEETTRFFEQVERTVNACKSCNKFHKKK